MSTMSLLPAKERPIVARIMFIEELTAERLAQLAEETIPIRVSGRLVHYDIEQSQAILEDNGAQLAIDTSLLSVFSHQLGGVYQFIGRIVMSSTPVTLVATIDTKSRKENSSVNNDNVIDSHYLLQATLVRDVNALDVSLILLRKRHMNDV
ncbi:hypothetical protein BDF22DRAFT_662547 [Syncephalis plumigaleata]|nr:hypothetical protein BDF22DRAFT_662547 [Syncephalis plumigaleata]